MGNSFAGRLRFLADSAGSGFALARETSVPQRSIANYLKGHSEPKLSRLLQIAEGMKVSVEWLATGQGPMMPGEYEPFTDVDRESIEYFSQRLSIVVELASGISSFTELTGFSRQKVESFLSGNTDPDLLSIQKIAKSVNVDVGWLVGGVNSLDPRGSQWSTGTPSPSGVTGYPELTGRLVLDCHLKLEEFIREGKYSHGSPEKMSGILEQVAKQIVENRRLRQKAGDEQQEFDQEVRNALVPFKYAFSD